MNTRVFRFEVRDELLGIVREPTALFFSVLLPVAFFALFATMFGGDGGFGLEGVGQVRGIWCSVRGPDEPGCQPRRCQRARLAPRQEGGRYAAWRDAVRQSDGSAAVCDRHPDRDSPGRPSHRWTSGRASGPACRRCAGTRILAIQPVLPGCWGEVQYQRSNVGAQRGAHSFGDSLGPLVPARDAPDVARRNRGVPPALSPGTTGASAGRRRSSVGSRRLPRGNNDRGSDRSSVGVSFRGSVNDTTVRTREVGTPRPGAFRFLALGTPGLLRLHPHRTDLLPRRRSRGLGSCCRSGCRRSPHLRSFGNTRLGYRGSNCLDAAGTRDSTLRLDSNHGAAHLRRRSTLPGPPRKETLRLRLSVITVLTLTGFFLSSIPWPFRIFIFDPGDHDLGHWIRRLP